MTTKITITAAPIAGKAVKVTISTGTVHTLTADEASLDVTLYDTSKITGIEEVDAAPAAEEGEGTEKEAE